MNTLSSLLEWIGNTIGANPNTLTTSSKTIVAAINETHDVDFHHPVGSYYETSDASFNPNNAWGGTWVLETAGHVHVSAGSGYAVNGANSSGGAGAKDGGHKDLQAHTHDYTHETAPSRESNIKNYISSASSVSSARGTISGSSTSDHNYVRVLNSGASLYRSAAVIPSGTCTGGGVGAVKDLSTGNGGNMMPYINVYRWHRTA